MASKGWGWGVLAAIGGLVAAIGVSAAPAPDAPPAPVAPLSSETRFEMASKITGRTYRVWIAKPLAPAPPGGYPVIYVTDGNGMFRLVADQMRVREFVDLKPAIVVGVGYPSDDIWDAVRLRNHDLTHDAPTGVFLPVFADWAKYGHYTAADTAGGELFYRFLAEEIRPRVAAMAPVDAGNQALFGHSLGGLFTLNVLFRHPQAFSTYIAASPSMIYNARSIFDRVAGFQAAVEQGGLHPRLLLVVGGLETYPLPSVLAAMPAEEARRWTKRGRETDDVMEMAGRLRQIKGGPGYQVGYHLFEGENHLSVIPAALSRALTFAFSTLPPVD